MASDPPPKLRKPGSAGETGTSGAEPLSSGMGVNAMAELVVDLLSATGLIPDDKLAMVRGRAGQGSLAQAIVDEGVAPPEGIARSLAVRYQVPLVDLALTGVEKDAAEQIPLHVLERVVAIPYALDNGTLRIAVADPGQPARDRRAQACDPLSARPRRRLERGHPHRAAPDGARLRGVRHPRRPRGGRRGAAEHRGGGETTSRSTTASPTRRSSGSSTRSSSRPPRTAPPTSTSSRRRTRSPSASASTACSRRCSGSRSG